MTLLLSAAGALAPAIHLFRMVVCDFGSEVH
jgi:hypothetical protein